ncbi:MAG: hypothetical protein NCW75_07345 [Phycisphaera sp.]|nr:MAG: hypothetical protein NCW75_07345 [Phycisphaera sp.]
MAGGRPGAARALLVVRNADAAAAIVTTGVIFVDTNTAIVPTAVAIVDTNTAVVGTAATIVDSNTAIVGTMAAAARISSDREPTPAATRRPSRAERPDTMIATLTGTITALEPGKVTLATAGGVAYEVLLPPYLSGDLPSGQKKLGKVGDQATLATVHVLESPNQGATFIPRLMGFATAADKEVYEAMTQIRGLGHRKALRALAEPPSEVAAMIARGDEVGLKRLPEIGAKLAKTLVDELGPAFRDKLAIEEMEAGVRIEAKPTDPQAEDAVRALVALGEQPAEASRKVTIARQKRGEKDIEASELVSLALSL